MAKTMTPSDKPITKGQIGKFYDVFADALAKSGLRSEPTQLVLATHGADLAKQFVALVRKHVDAISNMIFHTVTVDRTRSPQQVLDATGRTQYTDKEVVASMSKTQAEEELFFFKPRPEAYRDGLISDEALKREFDFLNLEPASPCSLAKANQDDPAFADEHPNGTHWKDAQGNWCFAAFDGWYGRRDVGVSRSVDDWHGRWWFAGVRK